MIGCVIASLTAIATVGGILFVVLGARSRWDVATVGGILVRFALNVEHTPALLRGIATANRAVLAVLSARFPREPRLQDYRVIVRPTGSMGRIGGTVKIERMLPVTPAIYVAIVHAEHAPYFIAHEVARHILPMRQGKGTDPAHSLAEYAAIETEIKARITRDLEHYP